MQPSRILAAVLIVFLSGTGPLSAQKLNYLEGQKLNLLKLVPPPPEPGSEGEKKDIVEVLEVQENRTPAEVELAIADDVLDIYRFETELGPKFKRQTCRSPMPFSNACTKIPEPTYSSARSIGHGNGQ